MLLLLLLLFDSEQVFFYSKSIFESAGIADEYVPYAVIGTNGVNVVMTLIAVYIAIFGGLVNFLVKVETSAELERGLYGGAETTAGYRSRIPGYEVGGNPPHTLNLKAFCLLEVQVKREFVHIVILLIAEKYAF